MKKQNSLSGRRAIARGRSDIHPAFFRDLRRLKVPTHVESLVYCRVVQAAARRILGLAPEQELDFEGIKYRTIIKRLRKNEREAFDQMVTRNLRLVIAISRRYNNSSFSDGDLVGFGVEGLMIAVLRFDPERDIKFSTYATWWIRQSIGRAIHDFGSIVRMSVHMHEKRKKIEKSRAKVSQQCGSAATTAELAKSMDVSEDWLLETLSRMVSAFSLNVKVNHEGYEIEYQDMTPDVTVRDPTDEAIANLDVAKLKRAMVEVLDPRERAVLYLRFNGELTLKEIGDAHIISVQEGRIAGSSGLSRERVRQIQDLALRKLRVALTENDPEPYEEPPKEPPRRGRRLRQKGYSYLH